MSLEIVRWDVPGLGELAFAIPSAGDDRFSARLRKGYRPVGAEALCIAIANEGTRMVDAGACMGTVSLPCARKGAKVLSVEALPSNVEILRTAIEANNLGSNMTIAHRAISDAKGELSLLGATAYGTVVAEGGDVVVPSDRLEAIMNEAGFDQIDLLKIDIEGSELRALRGSATLFEGDAAPDVVIEANGAHCIGAGYTPDDLLQFFDERGYQAFGQYARSLVPRRAGDFQELGNMDYYLTRDASKIDTLEGYSVRQNKPDEVVLGLLKWLESPNAGYRRYLTSQLATKRPTLIEDQRVRSMIETIAAGDEDEPTRVAAESLLA